MGSRLGRVAALVIGAVWGLAAASASAGDDDCFYCGMRRAEHGHSWVEIHYPARPAVGFCSLHCATVHVALHAEEIPAQILVSDFPTHSLIDAERAFWVIGGRRPGVMTARAKWAFTRKADAVRFVAENGGRLATMADATKAAVDDMYRDIRAIQKKQKDARTKALDRNRE